jgi:hypothetical protein
VAANNVIPWPGSVSLRRHLDGRLASMETYRYSWWVHWRELADYILPRRYKWLITPNQWNRGSPINQHIIDSTGTIAARTLASGIMSGVSSPTRPWFKLKIGRMDSTRTSPVSLWLAECERLMYLILKESNFYNSIAVAYYDLVVFGTAPMLIYEDFENVINCFNPCAGEYFVENDDRGYVRVFGRKFTLTCSQVVAWFGLENCSQTVKNSFNEPSGAGKGREVIIAHFIEPNDPIDGTRVVPKHFAYREVYWEWGTSMQQTAGSPAILSKRGFYEWPAAIPRWDLVSNDPYGRSPGMDALPDIKQLQQEQLRKSQGIDKCVNPPMVADIQMKNQPASLIPGGTTYVPGMAQGKVGFAPVYQVNPYLGDMMNDIKEVQERIRLVFFNNLFQMISQFEPKSNISATEIDARRSEQMVLIGPVLDRIDNELLKPAIQRVFLIASRAGIFPDAPPEIADMPMEIEYVSMLSEALNASRGGAVERLFAMAANTASIDPAVTDNIDFDMGLNVAATSWGVDPRVIRSEDALLALRQKREQQQAQQQQMANLEAATSAAKNLATSPTGPGRNALQSLAGGPL